MHSVLAGGTIVIFLKPVLRFGEEECLLAKRTALAEKYLDTIAGVSVIMEFFVKVSIIAKARGL